MSFFGEETQESKQLKDELNFNSYTKDSSSMYFVFSMTHKTLKHPTLQAGVFHIKYVLRIYIYYLEKIY